MYPKRAGREERRKLVPPLDKKDPFAVVVFKGKRRHLASRLQSVPVGVVDEGLPLAVALKEGEGGARHRSGEAGCFGHGFHKMGLSRAQRAFKAYDSRLPEKRKKFTSKGFRFL